MAEKSAALAEELYQAILKDQPLSKIRSLVERGADLEARVGANRYTALLWALQGDKHVDVALYLVDAGADPYASNGLGNALTYAACYGRDQRKLEGLLERKVLPDQPDDSGKTPLMNAAEQGIGWAAEMLIRNGADLYLKDPEGLSAFDYAHRKGKDFAETLASKSTRLSPPIVIMKPLTLIKKGPAPSP
ncbi:MAG: ankyrin repeat domain-containing protein [Alphaproteobacteria bacterium]